MAFTELSLDERRARVERGHAWRGLLTAEQFAERNDRLYRHRYGARAIHTYAWRDADEAVVSSMDCLDVRLLVRDRKGQVRQQEGGLIASVVTPDRARGKGYATRMLTEFFERFPERPFVLYSDIGAPFYERFGFAPFPVRTVVVPANVESKYSAVELTLPSFAVELAESRHATLAGQDGPAGALLPDADFIDWVTERYRFFASIQGKGLPAHYYWRVGDSPVAAAPDFVAGRLDLLWYPPGDQAAVAFAHDLARRWHLPQVRYWSPAGGGKAECPMIRIPGAKGARYVDVQIVDWW